MNLSILFIYEGYYVALFKLSNSRNINLRVAFIRDSILQNIMVVSLLVCGEMQVWESGLFYLSIGIIHRDYLIVCSDFGTTKRYYSVL
jgi:hypothetical protein